MYATCMQAADASVVAFDGRNPDQKINTDIRNYLEAQR
jgi:hypothetical protein